VVPSVLENVRVLAGRNRIAFTRHASERMWENGLSEDDVRHALRQASALFLGSDGRLQVVGVVPGGDELAVDLVFDGGLVIVTGFVEAR